MSRLFGNNRYIISTATEVVITSFLEVLQDETDSKTELLVNTDNFRRAFFVQNIHNSKQLIAWQTRRYISGFDCYGGRAYYVNMKPEFINRRP